MASNLKIVEVIAENALETYESQDMLLDKVDFVDADGANMQLSGNVAWRDIEQQAPTQSGWTVSAPTDIIVQSYPSILGTPENDWVVQRADDMRTTKFWADRGKASGRKQASTLNTRIASAMATQGSLFYRSNATSGYAFIAEAQATMNERQGMNTGRCFLINDRDNQTFSGDLAARQTLQGRPESAAWSKGQIGANVAGFDIYTGSFLPNIVGGADPATTVTGNQSFIPEGGSVNTATGVVTNVDYRSATIPVAASASYNVGDKVTIANGGVTVKALGIDDKTNTGTAMTFTIVAKPSGTSITVYPKPIALDDPALTTAQAAYANINTRILNAATVNRINTDATNKTNLFWDKDAIEVIGGTVPAGLFQELSGKKSIAMKMKNGQTMYMLYDGTIDDMNFRFRIFTWYGITVRDPSRVGVAVTF
jgi:hypothetical protein